MTGVQTCALPIFLVLGVGRFVVRGLQGQVELALAQVVLLGMIPQPGELQAEGGFPVPQENDDEAAVLRLLAADRLQAQGLLVEGQGAVQVGDVEIKVIERTYIVPRKILPDESYLRFSVSSVNFHTCVP